MNDNNNFGVSGNNGGNIPDRTLSNTNFKIDTLADETEKTKAEAKKIVEQMREAAGIDETNSNKTGVTSSHIPAGNTSSGSQTFAAEKISARPVDPATVNENIMDDDSNYTYEEKQSKAPKIIIIILIILAVGLAAGLSYSLVKLNGAKDTIKKQANKIEQYKEYSAYQSYAVLALRTELKRVQKINSKYHTAVRYLNEKNKAEQATAITEKEKAKAAENALEAQPGSVSPAISTVADLNTKKIAFCTGSDSGTLTKGYPLVLYRGHLETYYSSKNYKHAWISKMKLDKNGVYRDAKGFVCVAASKSQLKFGSYVNTSHGVGRVYDFGAASGCIDIYTNW